MALETKLVQKMNQQLLMTPQLQQAIKLLQLGRLEYKEAIEKELLENPILEEIREEDSDSNRKEKSQKEKKRDEEQSARNDESPVSMEDYLNNISDYRGFSPPRGTYDHENRPSLEATLTKEQTLAEYVLSQLRMKDITEIDEPIALYVVGNLDRNGYLCTTYEEIAEQAKCSVDDVQRVMETVKSLDPPGVGARNLGECLFIQLENMGLGNDLPGKIVLSHLDKLERRKYDQIAKAEKVAVEEVYEAIKSIQNLEPRPGRQFADEEVRYIVPDIYVYKVSGEYVISLNEDGLPKLRISPYYLQLLRKGEDKAADSENEYLQDRLKAASWLIKSIHQRQQTIFKVTESIVKHQTEFLDHGIAKLKPLVLKQVAEDIDMHESTVSRVTTNKYVHTPQGVFELKYFFTTGIKTASGEVSSSSVKQKIKDIIAEEPPENPVSDQQIVDLLAAENVKIARRTVAKYRESLGILSSSKRKKLF